MMPFIVLAETKHAIGRVERMGDQERGAAIACRLKEGCTENVNGLPYKVYNSVPVVLCLKPFRATGCTDRD